MKLAAIKGRPSPASVKQLLPGFLERCQAAIVK